MHHQTIPFPLQSQSPPQAIKAIGMIAEGFVGLFDALGGDPDIEADDSDLEPDGTDEGDAAWLEWTSMRRAAKRGSNYSAGPEDAEEDDGGGDVLTDDEPAFDRNSRAVANLYAGGSGCILSDSDVEHDGSEESY